MRKTLILIAVIGLISFGVYSIYFASFTTYDPEKHAWVVWNGNTLEYPLAKVDINDDSEYVLTKSINGKFEVITDTQAIKVNTSKFRVYNRGELYGTTADGLIELFKNGERIDSVIFDVFIYTPRIRYGSLKFREIDQAEYQLLKEK